jgi:anthranilate/para-aminobenzoate synthase component I
MSNTAAPQFTCATLRLPFRDALEVYQQISPNPTPGLPIDRDRLSPVGRGVADADASAVGLRGGTCLFESVSAVDKSSRMSVIGVEPPLEIWGKDDLLRVRLLHPRGQVFFDFLADNYRQFIIGQKADLLEFSIPKLPFYGPEEERLERQNIVQPLRSMLAHFKADEKNFMGLYGALAYRFVYQFEDIRHDKQDETPDFHLFLMDNILLFNHLTQDATLYVTRLDKAEAERDLEYFNVRIKNTAVPKAQTAFKIHSQVSSPDDAAFMEQVQQGIDLCFKGELLEIVLSRHIGMRVSGDPLPLYARYRKVNPSPYLFYFDFGDEMLLGASPELMLRYEQGRATLRPISGSVRRSSNPVEDHRLMMELLNSPKENSELDMLIDLGRNDLARICQPGIQIDHYRIIEKYSHVTHTVSQVSGVLEARYSGFDALIASLNAGTLTGAPKVAAMQYIEDIESHARGYYGGSIGWLLFNGEVNTAITIRTAHIKGDQLSYCTGATLLYQSEPESELQETKIKAGAFLAAVEEFR